MWNSKKSNNLLRRSFLIFFSLSVYHSSPFSIKILDQLFSRNTFLWLLQLIHVCTSNPLKIQIILWYNFLSVENATSTRYKLAFSLVSSSSKWHHSHLKSIMHWFPRCTFMLHFHLEKTKSTCCNLVAKGWGWNAGQNLSNCQATRQAENFES